ncbi:hypothetical protein AVEN_48146-1 [Araneus ventricosus]|uniref:Uncharacterized protein n=1 Tax=Araneus ventricosus TaxID=182803 RepID=A0A4Y2F7H2_ARAVE|nr:hypothetical protein AVEN_48146-1 [Araneus ventricosus]
MNQLTLTSFCVNNSDVFQIDFHKSKEIDLQYPVFVADEYVHSIPKKMQGVSAFLLQLDQWNRENSKLRERSFKDKGNSLPFSKPAWTPNYENPLVPRALCKSHSTLRV